MCVWITSYIRSLLLDVVWGKRVACWWLFTISSALAGLSPFALWLKCKKKVLMKMYISVSGGEISKISITHTSWRTARSWASSTCKWRTTWCAPVIFTPSSFELSTIIGNVHLFWPKWLAEDFAVSSFHYVLTIFIVRYLLSKNTISSFASMYVGLRNWNWIPGKSLILM